MDRMEQYRNAGLAETVNDLYHDYLREIDRVIPGSAADIVQEDQLNLHLEADELLLCLHCGTENLVPFKHVCLNPECKGEAHPKVFVLEYLVRSNIDRALSIKDMKMYEVYKELLSSAYHNKDRF